VFPGRAEAKAQGEGPLAQGALAFGGLHATGADAEERAGDLDGDDEAGVEEGLELGVAGLAADEAELGRALAAEGDGVVSEAEGDLAAELFHGGACGVEDGLSDGVAARGGGVGGLAGLDEAAAEGLGLVDGDAERAADGGVEVEAADVDGLDEADVVPAADDDLAAACADVDEDVDVVLVLLAADEAFDGSVEGAGLDVEGLEGGTGAVEVLDDGVDVVVAGGHDDDLLAELGALADLAGGEVVDAGVGDVEGEDVAGLELDDGGDLGGGDGGEAEVLGGDEVAGEGGDDAASAERVGAEHLSDEVGGAGEAAGGVGLGLGGQGHACGGGDLEGRADGLDLEHPDAVVADVDADGQDLCSCEPDHASPLCVSR
jgi:hypothetical protein